MTTSINTNTTTTKAAATSPKGSAPFALEDVHMIEATTPALIQKTWGNNWEEWAKGVHKPTYYEREIALSKTAFSSHRNLRTWILVPKSFDPSKDSSELDLEEILSAVESYERPGIVATVEKGRLEDVTSYSIASVYTPAKYRRHGYGSLLMRFLWDKLTNLGGSFSFLYSDVGPTFYGQVGWAPRRCEEIKIETSYILPPVSAVTPLEIITDATLDTLVAHDHHLLRQSLQHRIARLSSSASSSNIKTLVAVTPEPNCFRWLHTRAQFNAVLKNPTGRDPADLKITALGVKDPQSNNHFVIWYHDFFADQLLVLRWRLTSTSSHDDDDDDTNTTTTTTTTLSPDPITLLNLGLTMVAACQDEAKKWGLGRVTFWNPDKALSDLVKIPIATRPDSIPSLGLLQVPIQSAPETVEWVMNEHYSWYDRQKSVEYPSVIFATGDKKNNNIKTRLNQ
ncbi:hypothetical protein BG004_005311 [Podila humilis]|nr:hypothetical protein BG004_005311 [Podila humilis]